MPSGTKKSKCTFRKVIGPEPVAASELNCVERTLARFVALAYAADHAGLFTVDTAEPFNGTTSLSEVPSSRPTRSRKYETS
jgi:hypothetical protein